MVFLARSVIQILDWKMHVDVNVLKLLSNELNFTYDGNRIKWTGDLDSLKLFVENVIGLTGVWRSPGGYAKQFKSTECPQKKATL